MSLLATFTAGTTEEQVVLSGETGALTVTRESVRRQRAGEAAAEAVAIPPPDERGEVR